MDISTFPNRKLTLLLMLGIVVSVFMHPFSINAQDEPDAGGNDMLAYVSQEGHLMLYNPQTRTETLLFENVRHFLLSPNGYLAFSKSDETDNNLYFSDLSTPSIAPIIISQNAYPVHWSPDGRYLTFGSLDENDNHSLFVWDGETITNVMPDDPLAEAQRFYPDWSSDGRLAFTIVYGWSNLAIPPEIYLWDGDKTVNLSQNPEGWDSAAIWSNDGQLLFSSFINEEYVFYVWDGVSFKDGLPDGDSFMPLAPDLELRYARWISSEFIGFTTYLNPQNLSDTKVITIWDVEEETIIEQYPITSENAWSWLTEDGQLIISTHLASGRPSYYLDIENLAGEILFSTQVGEFSWSSEGYLAYCLWDEGWILSIWDGEETWDVSTATYKPVQWQSVGHIFSCNSG